jgi:RNA methyltransferase, TrmH family
VLFLRHVAITSRQNPIVARYRAAARGDDRSVLLLDGVHLIADGLRAGIAIGHAAVTPAAQASPEIAALVASLGRTGSVVDTVSAPVMDALSPVRSAAGIVALGARPAHRVDDLFSGARSLVIVAVDVQDPGNVGAIARVAEAGGATGLAVAGASADPFGWKALRGSMGSSLRLPIASSSAGDAVAAARRHGCRIIAAVPRDGRTLYDSRLTGPIALLIGGEGPGLSQPLGDQADERVTIPMEAPVESLNTAVAAALIVYEARRQRAPATRRHEAS